MHVKTYPIIRTFGSYVLPKRIIYRPGSGGSYSAEYCYSVWLRHLVQLQSMGIIENLDKIKTVAEIGPGDSLGFGIAALLSGAVTYHAFDVIEHANLDRNIKIVRQLEQFFIEEKEIPHDKFELRNTNPKLKDYSFPKHLYNMENNSDQFSKRADEVIKALRKTSDIINIEYVVPWHKQIHPKEEGNLKRSVDLIFSQAVMEHVSDIQEAYDAMYQWLKPGGIISHQIDYKAHEMSKYWDGHWFINNHLWNFLLRGRKYPINRFPHSEHIRAITNAGFKIKNIVKDEKENNFPNLNPELENISFTDEDRTTGSALIQAVKP